MGPSSDEGNHRQSCDAFILYFAIYTLIILIIMDTTMMAVIATMVLPMFAAAREGPECPTDPYVRVYRHLQEQ
jgi:hypothetical protein